MAKVIQKDFSNNNSKVNSVFFEKNEELSHEYIPKSFDEYIGQKELKERLNIYISSAKKRNTCLDHMLLFGPPGLGKTTLTQVIAKEMCSKIKITSGPTLQKTGDMVAILSNLKANDIFFIDEIHRLPIHVEETLYSAMEQYKVDIIIGQGTGAKTVVLSLQPFTLIGATTKVGLLSAPLRSRFGIIEKFDWYNENDLIKIVQQASIFYNIILDDQSARLIASSSRGTPRIAKKLTKKIRDYIVVESKGIVKKDIIIDALNFFGVLPEGLTYLDIHIMKILYDKSPLAVGLDTIAALTGEESQTIEDVYEPFLLQKGFIEKTSRGRIIPDEKKNLVYNIIRQHLN